jgi:hypothetical protein
MDGQQSIERIHFGDTCVKEVIFTDGSNEVVGKIESECDLSSGFCSSSAQSGLTNSQNHQSSGEHKVFSQTDFLNTDKIKEFSETLKTGTMDILNQSSSVESPPLLKRQEKTLVEPGMIQVSNSDIDKLKLKFDELNSDNQMLSSQLSQLKKEYQRE